MLAVDTNVLLRYLLQDDPKQGSKASHLFEHKAVLITDIVLVEMMWTLRGARYRLKKDQQINVLDHLFREPNVHFEDGSAVWRAQQTYRTTAPVKVGKKKKDADFADILILEKARRSCSGTGEHFEGMVSFDKVACQVEGIDCL